ncbi:MAG: CRTAC1 family protein [Planctomycetota bacterium]
MSQGLKVATPSRDVKVVMISDRLRFEDVASQLGIQHRYDNGAAGQSLMVEATGGGAGWFDFDLDGRLDLYLTQGGNPAKPGSPEQPPDRLFRQVDEGSFRDVADRAGTAERGYSQGVVMADFDQDGFADIYVTNVGSNVLYRNNGDGTFENVTDAARVADQLWSSSAAWGDLDLDGDLDLYVCNYVDFDPSHPRICRNSKGVPAMCHPNQMQAVPDHCFINLGDGTFHEEARQRGLFGDGNKGLGVAIADLNNDGLPDVFVANDTTPNFLFVNQGGGQFVESAMLLGCAVSGDGLPQANMGIGLGDYDRNGFLDIYVTHFVNEWNTLYQNLGPRGFHDVSGMTGLVRPPLTKLGFGTVMHDFDRDGLQDLFVANGHIDDHRSEGGEWAMTPQVLSYDGRRWHEVSATAGDFFRHKVIGRGVASGDFDDDGRLDLAVVHQDANAAVLRNVSQGGHWLKVRLVGRTSNRSAIGSHVVVRAGNDSWMQELAGGTSYCASHEPALLFGLGEVSTPVRISIRWPNGHDQELNGISVDRIVRMVEE